LRRPHKYIHTSTHIHTNVTDIIVQFQLEAVALIDYVVNGIVVSALDVEVGWVTC